MWHCSCFTDFAALSSCHHRIQTQNANGKPQIKEHGISKDWYQKDIHGYASSPQENHQKCVSSRGLGSSVSVDAVILENSNCS